MWSKRTLRSLVRSYAPELLVSIPRVYEANNGNGGVELFTSAIGSTRVKRERACSVLHKYGKSEDVTILDVCFRVGNTRDMAKVKLCVESAFPPLISIPRFSSPSPSKRAENFCLL